MSIVNYRVTLTRGPPTSIRTWELKRDDALMGVFASRFGAEAEGRRKAHLDCAAGFDCRLTVFESDGNVDAVFEFAGPPCEPTEIAAPPAA